MTTDQSPTSTHPSSYPYIVVDTNSLVASTTSTRHGSMAIKTPRKSLWQGIALSRSNSPNNNVPKVTTVCRKEGRNTHTTKKTKNKIRKLPLYYFKSIRRLPYIHITFYHQTSVPPMHFASKQASKHSKSRNIFRLHDYVYPPTTNPLHSSTKAHKALQGQPCS